MIYIAVEHPFPAMIGPFVDDDAARAFIDAHVDFEGSIVVDTRTIISPDVWVKTTENEG